MEDTRMDGPENTGRALRLADTFWERLLELEPLIATSVGDERFDDRLGDPGPDGRAALEEASRAVLDELAAIDVPTLPASLRGTLDVAEAMARRSLAELEHREDRLRVASHFAGPAQILAEIASLQRADTPERLNRYVARLRAIPRYLEAWSTIAREGVATGVTSPRVVAERAVAQVERLLALAPQDSPALLPAGEDPAARERIAAVVRDDVNPAFEGFLGVLRETLPAATETLGVTALPDGEALYATAILGWTSLPLDPADVHRIGVETYAAIQEERRAVAARLGFASADEALAAHEASGANHAATREAMLELARSQVERSWELAKGWFGRMPIANCEVKPVEEFREADTPGGFYFPPTEDGTRPGAYFINTSDLDQRPLHHVAALTYHEANPGHHFQISLDQEATDRPPLRRFGGIFAGSAYAEGWGLYSERLADEMGLYVDDWERLGMLESQGLRAARLVTDTGIHALGWDRERSIATLVAVGMPLVDATIEVDRYISLPGQALAYMIGMREIVEARRATEAREGSGFVLSDFHDRVLALGSLPLPAFRREMGLSGTR
jgi:uncharacterized protein (DUF885 family)